MTDERVTRVPNDLDALKAHIKDTSREMTTSI